MQRYYLPLWTRARTQSTGERIPSSQSSPCVPGQSMSLHDRIATPDGKRRYVRALFATIAERYDVITVMLSYGQDRRWKRRLIELAAPSPGARALDLATGTGDIAFALALRGSS